MSNLWSIVLPVDAENKCKNPSFETGTTDYVAIGTSTIAQSTTQRRWGRYSGKITPSSGSYDGAYYAHPETVSGGQPVTGSAYFWATAGNSYQIAWLNTSNVVQGTPTTFTAVANQWMRVSVTHTPVGSSTLRLGFQKNNSANTNDFYIDGVQIENSAYATLYFDGDQPGAAWLYTKHASYSRRADVYAFGGRELMLSTADGLYVETFSGVGMTPVELKTADLLNRPGSSFVGTKNAARPVTLAIKAIAGQTAASLHAVRKAITDAFSNNRTKELQFLMLYYGANQYEPLALKVSYTSGLDFSGANHPSLDAIPLRVIGLDPGFRKLGEATFTLDTLSTLTDPQYMISRINNTWGKMGTGFNGQVYAVIVGPDGYVYFGGAFTTANGVTVNKVCRWNGTTFEALSTGLSGGDVYALAFGPTGKLYAGGSFTTPKRIAVWDGASWSVVGAGLDDGTVYCIRYVWDGTNERVYIGGSFTTNSSGNMRRFAYFAPSSPTITECRGFDGTVYTIAEGHEQGLYLGGDFTQEYAGSTTGLNRFCRFYSSTVYKYGTGANDTIRKILVDKRGNIFVFGKFTTINGLTSYQIAKYDGVQWVPVTDYTWAGSITFYDATFDPSGLIWVVGTNNGVVLFDPATLTAADPAYFWNNSTGLPTVATYAVLVVDKQPAPDIYFAVNASTGTYDIPSINSLTYTGTMPVYPVIVSKYARTGGSVGYGITIRNLTTGTFLDFSPKTLCGETVTLDLRPQTRGIKSDFRSSELKSLLNEIAPLSDLEGFTLVNGVNLLEVLSRRSTYTGALETDFDAYLRYELIYNSADGGA